MGIFPAGPAIDQFLVHCCLIFFTNLNDDVKTLMAKSADDTKLGEVINNEEAGLMHLLVKQSRSSRQFFSIAKYRVMHLSLKNMSYTYRMGTVWKEVTQRKIAVSLGNCLIMNSQYNTVAKRVYKMKYIKWKLISDFVPMASIGKTAIIVSSFGIHFIIRMWKYYYKFKRGPQK